MRHSLRAAVLLVISATIVTSSGCGFARHRREHKEAKLRDELFAMRSAIDQFTLDKQRAPQSLDDLVQAGYLREIPIDPITNTRDSWVLVNEDVMQSIDQTQPGITDVHSGSEETALDGSAYASW